MSRARRSRQIRSTRKRHIGRVKARRGEAYAYEPVQHGEYGSGHSAFWHRAKGTPKARISKLARVVARPCWPT